jgi:two-component system cell cycle sensor histidine kinase/response regulator CckA
MRKILHPFARPNIILGGENRIPMPTILVVDDEPAIRRLIGSALEEGGFRVLSAENGLDALHVSESHPGEIDLVVSDVKMPGMDGPALARRLLAVDPDLPVLFISGYWEDGWLPGDRRFPVLSKPFELASLLSTVRDIVGSPAAIPRKEPATVSGLH